MPPHSAPPDGLAHTDRGSGDRIVLVHGFTQSSASFDRIGAAFADRYEVRAVDLPGHGRSTDTAARNLSETAELLGETGGRATYLGYSLGGRVALTLAHAHPELVSRLVLVGATAGIVDTEERRERRRSDERLADRLDPPSGDPLDLEEFLDEWLAQPLFAHLTSDAQDRPSRRVNTPAGLARSLRAVGTGTQAPTHDRLRELGMPILLVAGARDVKFSAIAAEMAAAIGPNSSVALVEDAVHAAPFEQPDRFADLVRTWLANH